MTENKSHNPETVKWMCVLAYILFFVPLIVIPDSEDGKFHANQGLTLLLAALAVEIAGRILTFLPFIGYLGFLISLAGEIAFIILAIMGIVNALNMEQKKLPIIGEYTLIR